MSNKQKEVWCAGETWCPVTATATLIGRKWHPVIVLELLQTEAMGFNDLKTAIEGVSSKVLSEALEDLEVNELVDREIVNEKPVRVAYSLTELGRSLEPVIRAMAVWGTTHLHAPDGMESVSLPPELLSDMPDTD